MSSVLGEANPRSRYAVLGDSRESGRKGKALKPEQEMQEIALRLQAANSWMDLSSWFGISLFEYGIEKSCIFCNQAIELPGWFRAEKKWDLLVVVKGQADCGNGIQVSGWFLRQ